MKKLLLIATLVVLTLSGCNLIKTEIQMKTLDDAANSAITALQNKDMKELSAMVHPEKGVRFSPYGFVDIVSDIDFDADELEALMDSDKEYLWGVYDGSGFPIEKTFKEYFDEFVYDQDFANAEQTAKNEVIGTGNTINNLAQVYPNAEFVEYYFSGFDPQYGGMDWVSLRLVFEQMDGNWYLVGIVHDEWTI